MQFCKFIVFVALIRFICHSVLMQRFWQKNWKSLVLILALVVSLPLTVPLAQKAWRFFTGASFVTAAIVVDASQSLGPVERLWDAVAQGYEKPADADLRLSSVASIVKPTGVKYVRIDHVLNGYNVVSRGGDGRLSYDWTKLDAIVGDILAMGATPFFAVSYMPEAISKGDILDFPKEWGEWGQVVAALVGRYSRDYRGGLNNVIYEVWNEPDLFGGWKMGGAKNYVTLYSTAANAANRVQGAKPFKIGGPATTGFYPAWVNGFYNKLDDSVRIDFFSWHRYTADVATFVKDVNTAVEMMQSQISRSQELYITEWGVNPERGSQYDGRWAAAHYLAVNRALLETKLDYALAFEIMDGSPADKGKFHGGWGMLTNPKFGAIAKKPRFVAWEMISKMQGERLASLGDGTFVTGFATRDSSGVIRVLAVNYDEAGKHDELFPLNILGLSDGVYTLNEQYLSGRTLSTDAEVIGGTLRREINLSESDAVLLTIAQK